MKLKLKLKLILMKKLQQTAMKVVMLKLHNLEDKKSPRLIPTSN